MTVRARLIAGLILSVLTLGLLGLWWLLPENNR